MLSELNRPAPEIYIDEGLLGRQKKLIPESVKGRFDRHKPS
jgi:hypothetical protein